MTSVRALVLMPFSSSLGNGRRYVGHPGRVINHPPTHGERGRYAQRFGLPADVLTMDAHVGLDGQEINLDHTTVAMPNLPAAIREASGELVAGLFAELTAEHPGTLNVAWLLAPDGQVHQVFPCLG